MKLEERMLSIGKFAELAGTTRSKLLYYDRMEVFSPVFRQSKEKQEANRYYSLEQLYEFQLLELLQKAGCSLKDFSDGQTRGHTTELFAHQLALVERKILTLQRMRESLTMMAKLERLVSSTDFSHPYAMLLKKPLYCRCIRVHPKCARNSPEFARVFAKACGEAFSCQALLPAPIATIYSPAIDANGYLPVQGILIFAREGERYEGEDAYILPEGNYLLAQTSGYQGHFGDRLLETRRFLIEHGLRRVSPILAWTFGTERTDDGILFRECAAMRTEEGETLPGELPFDPEIDRLAEDQMVEVVAALIWRKGKFLICQRPAHKARGLLWEFVGGKVEPGETKAQALIRECREELAITLRVGDVFMDVVHEYPDLTVHLTLFHATIAQGTPQLLEHNALEWIGVEEIPRYSFCPADQTILERLARLK